MPCDAKLVERVKRVLDGEPGIGERRMFGGVCFTVHGNMACGVQNDELVVRVGSEAQARALRERFARPMDFTGRPMKGYVYIAAAGCADLRSTRQWVLRGVQFARSLPRKRARRA